MALAATMFFCFIQSASAQATTTINNVFITWYGFNDNSCVVETEYSCNTIAYPMKYGFPTKHEIATEDKGTYTNPITFAAAADDNGGNAAIAPGSIIYVPIFRKYFIMEDQCYECILNWKNKLFHIDLWMGPSSEQNALSLYGCQYQLTQGDNAAAGTGVIIVNPPSDLPVETIPIYRDGKCTTRIYPSPQSTAK